MERLTKWNESSYKHAYYPRCFKEPCYGRGCKIKDCPFEIAVCERLAAYEDTGLTPEEINDLASVREIPPEAEYAINKHADSIIERLDKLLAQTDDDVRLRELAEADKDGRVIILPCKVYETDGVRVYEHTVREVIYETAGGPAFDKNAIGKSIFLTRAEAERALQEMEGKKDG